MSRVRYQVRFTKTGLLRWISHRDLARLWERLLRRSGLQLAMTEGFHPKPRISFPSALALGTESLDEVVELDLTEELSAAELLERLSSDLRGDAATAAGMQITRVCRIPEGFGKAQLACGHFALEWPPSDAASDALASAVTLDPSEVEARIERLRAAGTIRFTRKDKPVEASVAEQIVDLAVRDGRLEMVLRSSRTASLRPDDVLTALGLQGLVEAGGRLTRFRTELDRELDPAELAAADCAEPNSAPTHPSQTRDAADSDALDPHANKIQTTQMPPTKTP
ncbi:TIGR03936 family radical SAM-associated protein [Candidatus Laterigemmans baculatus]|uniref:TIGR03936 family radical SAM-associated protein n=1 Tax=Candidatus Laterigemmans baculatus TaxID=2770505 RepID=UPI0013DAF05A|nr:TIGR03936 family radical SAM-associated protein [Candidatus Laterigemmans baculatus]